MTSEKGGDLYIWYVSFKKNKTISKKRKDVLILGIYEEQKKTFFDHFNLYN